MSVEATELRRAKTQPSSWRWRTLAIGLPVLLAGFAANHLEGHYRQKRAKAAADAGSLVVRAESSLAGHSQIGIDEASLGSAQERPLLRFAMLGEWAFDPQKPSPCPEAIRALSGREACCVGFMYPLEAGTRLRRFCLLRTTQTCCYGPRPQYNQYLFVELKAPVKFERFAPVMVAGKFLVDPHPEQGYIYRMEGTSVAPAAEDEPEVDAAQVALKAKVPLFDFAALSAMDGQPVVMEGFILDRKQGPPPRLVLARNWWDGQTQGKPPTIYSAATVYLRGPGELPPVWKQKGVFRGTLRVARDPASWSGEGIVSLQEAGRAQSGRGQSRLRMDSGPFLAVPYELLILAAFLFLAIRAARPRPMTDQAGGPRR